MLAWGWFKWYESGQDRLAVSGRIGGKTGDVME